MTRASDLARLIGAGATINDGTTITTADNTTQLTLTSTDADANVGPVLDLIRDSASPADGDSIGEIVFKADDDGGNSTEFASIQTKISDASNGSEDGKIEISTIVAGTSQKMINIKSNEIAINDDSIDVDFRVESNGNANMLFVDGGNDRVGIGTSPSDILHIKDTSSTNVIIDAPTDNATLTLQCGSSDSGAEGAFVNFIQNTTSKWQLGLNTDNAFRLYNYNTSSEALRIDSSGNVGIGTTSMTTGLELHGATANACTVKLRDTGSYSSETGPIIAFQGRDNSEGFTNFAQISGISNSSDNGMLKFETRTGGSLFERVMIRNNGRIQTFNCSNSNGSLNLVGEGGSSNRAVSFQHTTNGSEVGFIQTSSSATNYDTSSDYRLKENLDYDFDATSRLKQLKPVRFNFKIDKDNTVDGFLAHEVSSIVPNAISGEKDGVQVWEKDDDIPNGVSVGDDKLDNNGDTIPDYQSIDHSKLVPLLVKTIQELEARITALESK